MTHLNGTTALRRTAAAAAALALSGVSLAACSGSSTTSGSASPSLTTVTPSASASPTHSVSRTATPTATSPKPTTPTPTPTGSAIGGGSAPCTKSAIKSAVQTEIEKSGNSLIKLQNYACRDGWAFAVASYSNFGGPIVTQTYVFQAEGAFWIPVNLSTACGTSKATAKIPPSLYNEVCKNFT